MIAQVRSLLSTIVDPELGVNIVDLGLVYNIHISPNNTLSLLLTFTTPTCPYSDSIMEQIYSVLEPLDFDDVHIDITFDPVWSQSMMSEEALLQTGLL